MTITADNALRAPFPWHGGKRRIAGLAWSLLGADAGRYIEPFAGSLGVLLGRPGGAPQRGLEVANDIDGYIVNTWRALRENPDATIAAADDLRSELCLTARHLWLVENRERLLAGLQTDPSWHDTEAAGAWLYGISLWIGDAFASGTGPWTRERLGGAPGGDAAIKRQLPNLGDDGQGVQRQLPNLGDDGKGVHRQLGDGGSGVISAGVYALARDLQRRIARCVITCGDWQRVLSPAASHAPGGTTAILLDPPYPDHEHAYAASGSVWDAVTAWCDANAASPHRIVLCGHEGDYTPPDGWRTIAYTAKGSSSANRGRERLWASPSCVGGVRSLFEDAS